MARTCDDCKKRAACTKICAEVEAQLPGERAGSAHSKEKLSGLFLKNNGLRGRELEFRRAVLDLLTGPDREIAEKFFWLGMNQSQIATECGVSRRTVIRRIQKIKKKCHILGL